MANIALIACDNGFGHIRRQSLTARALAARGAEVTLFAPKTAAQHFLGADIGESKQIRVVDFNTKTSLIRLKNRADDVHCWVDSLPDLDVFSLVVSDNLPEILLLRPDAILSGHFFWHKILDNAGNSYNRLCDELLLKYSPRMISSGFFSSPYINQDTRLHKVGLYGRRHGSGLGKQNLLVSCGRTGNLKTEMADFVFRLRQMGNGPYEQVFVEPDLLPSDPPGWMKAADFSSRMYESLSAIICRPGIGTLTDGILAGARIFCVYETENSELAMNAATVVRAGIGEDCHRPGRDDQMQEAYRISVVHSTLPAAITRHLEAVNKIGDGGEISTAKLLLDWAHIRDIKHDL